MGWIGRLFGKSEEKDAAADRCNECGMTSGRHTDWCPLAAPEREDDRNDRPQETSGGATAPPAG